MTRLELGPLLITPGVCRLLIQRPELAKDLARALVRYQVGDWGELSPEDRAVNRRALEQGFRVLGAYHLDEHEIWIITEADRSYTTILLPEEY